MSSQAVQAKIPSTLLGSMAFGGRADADLSFSMVQEFMRRGHQELDTAFMYTEGQAETIIGGMQLPQTSMTFDYACKTTQPSKIH